MAIPPVQPRTGFERDILKYNGLMVFFAVCLVVNEIFLGKITALRVIFFVLTQIFFAISYCVDVSTKPPKLDPHTYCKRGGGSKPVFMFVGDSITHQGLSGRFCDMMQMEFKKELDVVVCAQNSIATETVDVERVGWSLECKPSYVSILIGTNDIKGIYLPEWGKGTKESFNLKHEVSYKSFRDNLKSIVQQYIKASKTSKILLHTLPPMGENLESKANDCVRKANEIIIQVVKGFEKTGRVKMIDTYAMLVDYLEAHSTDEERKVSLKVDKFSSVLAEALIKHNIFGVSYDTIGAKFGLKIMVDALHLNDTGAMLVADGISVWLRAEMKSK